MHNLDNKGIVDPTQDYPLYSGFVHLGAGLACGVTGMAAGYAVGIVGDSVRPMKSLSVVWLNVVCCSAFAPTSENPKYLWRWS